MNAHPRVPLRLLAAATGILLSPSLGAGNAAAEPSDRAPVTVANVRRQDFPVYVEGLGLAQGLNTAVVRAQVEGQISEVAFREGELVRAGDVLVQIDPRLYQVALDGLVAKQAEDAAQLAAEKKTLARFAALLEKRVIDQQAFDGEEAAVAVLEARIKADAAAVAEAKIRLDYCTVRAPIDGRTGMRLVDQGNIVRATDAAGLVVLTQIQPLAVTFKLPEKVLGDVNAAMANAAGRPVVALLIDRDGAVLARGRLDAIDSQIESGSGTFKAKAIFANEDRRLWPGQFCHVRLITDVRRGGLVLPGGAIQQGPSGAFVYVVGPDNRVEVRSVKVARIGEGTALIDSGLTEGETVVTDGQYLIRPGAQVAPKSR